MPFLWGRGGALDKRAREGSKDSERKILDEQVLSEEVGLQAIFEDRMSCMQIGRRCKAH